MPSSEPSGIAPSVQDVLDTLNLARRQIMAMYGGNLDHPALDHVEYAMGEVEETDREIRCG